MKTLTCVGLLLLSMPAWMSAQQTPAAASTSGSATIQLRVIVTEKKGAPVAGLTQQDFTVIDNGQPQKIESFQAHSAATAAADPPVEAIIVLDTLNQNPLLNGQARTAIEQFLRMNGGHLSVPTSVMIFDEDGLRGQSDPSKDGNALAVGLEKLPIRMRSIGESTGGQGDLLRYNLTLQNLGTLVETVGPTPGWKLLIWVGPGSPLMDGLNRLLSPEEKLKMFTAAVSTSQALREEQVTMYSVSIGQPDLETVLYQGFVKGVKSGKDMLPGDLNTKVFAVQSGGLVLGPDNRLEQQISNCEEDVTAYYTITYDAPRTEKRDEYHGIQIKVDKPGMKARSITGYYDEP